MTHTDTSPVAVPAADFENRVLDASREKLLLVDFWAAWCGPCKALSPILEQVAAAEAHRVTVAKVDVDAEPDLAAAYGVRALPTLVLFRNGQPVDRIVGLQSAAAIRARLDAVSVT